MCIIIIIIILNQMIFSCTPITCKNPMKINKTFSHKCGFKILIIVVACMCSGCVVDVCLYKIILFNIQLSNNKIYIPQI